MPSFNFFRWALRGHLGCLLLLLSTACSSAQSECPTADSLSYQVIQQQAHSEQAFTQGLTFANGRLIEGTGLYGRSRVIVHGFGKPEEASLPPNRFGEGLTWFDNKLWQLTWKAGELRIYSLDPLELVDIWRYQGEGWGLAHDGQQFILSNGTPFLSLRNSRDFTETKRVLVRDGHQALNHINELEWVDGQLFANIWQQDRIAQIDIDSGCVTAWLELADLWPRMIRPPSADVLNGIAWNAKTGELWVTGKKWPRLYQLKIDTLKPPSP